jgi:predicted MFS family arabinose efflux permease
VSVNAGRWSASARAFRDALSIGPLRRVLGAWALFNAAEWAIWVAILVYAYAEIGPGSVAIVAVAQLIPAAIGAPLTARLADRVAPERALGVAYAVIGVAMLATGLAMLTRLPPVVVVILGASVVVAYTTVRPVQIAILPSLVGRAEQLTAANALSTILEGAGVLVGPLLCGLLIAVASPGAAYVAAGVSTVLAALLVARLPVASDPVVAGSVETDADDRPDAAQAGGDPTPPTASILALLREDPARPLAILLLAIRFGVAAAMDVLLVFAAIELLGMGQAGAGYLSAAIGLGWVAGGASTMVVVGRPRLTPLLLIGAVIWAVPVVALAVVAQPAAALLGLVVAGVGLAVVDVAVRTILQRLVAPDDLARMFGAAEAGSMAGAASGALAAGVLVAGLGLPEAIMVAGALLPVAAILVLRPVGRGEAAVRIPFREIALLRRTPLFAPVPAPALEAAAARLVPVTWPAGAEIIHEGDVGDRFWVVDTGTVQVRQGPSVIGELGPGDTFGEIALLHDIPRTASVMAVTQADLIGLERNAFLTVHGSSGRARDEGHRAAAAALHRDAARLDGGR